MKLSVAMIVKNEEKNLDRTLKALNNVVGQMDCEIIIVDTGSSDRTIEIAKKYTEKVYEHEWTGNFSQMRNISISYCTGEWILILDADEVLVNSEEMINFFKSPVCEMCNSASIKIRSVDENSNNTENDAALIRIFRNVDGFKYTGKVHEQPKKMPPIAKSNIEFLHYGYSSDDYELMNYKFKRNIKLLKEELETADTNHKIYVLFQLSKSYAMAKKDDIAFKYIKMSYDLEEKNNKKIGHTYVYHWYASMLFNRDEFKSVIDVCKEMMRFTDDNMDIYYMMAISYSRLDKYKAAYKYYDKYFELKEQRDRGEYPNDLSLSESSRVCVGKMRCNRIFCYYKEERYDDIIREFEKNIEEVQEWKDICGLYIYSCMCTNKLNKISEFYNERELDDFVIEKMLKYLSEIEYEKNSIDVKEVEKIFSSLDERFTIYFDTINTGKIEKVCKIDFSNYCMWKERILEKAIMYDINNLNLIKNLNNEVIKCYIGNLIVVYENLEAIYNYCERKFLVTDISELNFVCDIENVLLFNKSISGDKYKTLVLRALINRHMFRKKVFNKELLYKENLKCFLDKFDRFYLSMEDELKKYSSGRLLYLKEMNDLLKVNKEFSPVIKMFLKEVNDNPISDEMVKEKDRIINVIENYISVNKVHEAEAIIKEIESIFKWEKEIYNCKGIINYINGEFHEALFNLSLASMLMEDKFDPIYNIACVLEKMDRVKDSIVFYKEALQLCEEESMKKDIENVLEVLV